MQMDLQQLKLKAEIKVLFQDSVFTIVEARYPFSFETVFYGEGLARKSHLDMPNAETGREVATGRALKALRTKLLKGQEYPIRHRFMA